jgi:putative peptidoglycan lipid II flippase
MGVLNTFRSFALSAAGPAILNLSVIIFVPACLLLFFPHTTYGIFFFAGALVIGGLLQALIQLPDLKRYHALPKFEFQWKDPRVKELGFILLPSMFSLGVYQLNIIINRNFASSIPGAVSHLFYADLLLELPVSLIATSVGTAVVPSFSRLLSENNRKGLSETFSFSMEAVQMLAIPATFGLIVLSKELVSTLYLTGKFTNADADITAQALVMYGLGLPFFSALRIILPLFFSQKDTKTPAKIGFIALAVNFIAAFLLSRSYAAPGIALATTISSVANVLILLGITYQRFRDFEWITVLTTFFKMLIAGAGMAAVLLINRAFIPTQVWSTVGIRFEKIALLLMLVILGSVAYFVFAYLLKIPHSEKIFKRLLGRLKKS